MTPPPAAAGATAPSPAYAPPRRAPSPARPGRGRPAPTRRISGPAPTARPSGAADAARRPLPSPAEHAEGIVVALARALARLGEHRLLVRLIRGRAWIVIVAFALIGIVTLQLGLLELNTSIGRTLERVGTLQRENAALSVENSEMASGELVEADANKLGMALVPEGALRFLVSHPHSDVARAAAALDVSAHARAEAEAAARTRAAEAATASSSRSESESSSGEGSSTGESSSGESSGSSETGAGESTSAGAETGSGESSGASSPTG